MRMEASLTLLLNQKLSAVKHILRKISSPSNRERSQGGLPGEYQKWSRVCVFIKEFNRGRSDAMNVETTVAGEVNRVDDFYHKICFAQVRTLHMHCRDAKKYSLNSCEDYKNAPRLQVVLV